MTRDECRKAALQNLWNWHRRGIKWKDILKCQSLIKECTISESALAERQQILKLACGRFNHRRTLKINERTFSSMLMSKARIDLYLKIGEFSSIYDICPSA